MRFAHALLSSVTTVSLLLSALLLVGCGQKGPLYLPQDDSTAAPVDNAVNNTKAEPKPGLKPESETGTAQQ